MYAERTEVFGDDVDADLSDNVCIISDSLISEISGVESTRDFSSIVHLDLHLRDGMKGKIRTIENMSRLTGLTQLNLSYNAINRIQSLDNLKNLVELNLAENAITKIENLDNLISLQRLNLSGNQIERISPSIGNLTKLSMLRIARNKLGIIRDLSVLGQLSNLTHLRIDENPFSNLEQTHPYAIYCVRNLQVLDGHQVLDDDRDEAVQLFEKEQGISEYLYLHVYI